VSDRKLVSVITGTWQRHDELKQAIENVRQQTYPNLEHVIVSDGPDPALSRQVLGQFSVRMDGDWPVFKPRSLGRNGLPPVSIRFVELGRNWSTYLTGSYSCIPFMVANYLAAGEYQLWLSDDERMAPDHIESLVTLLEETGADFAYSLVDCYHADTPEQRWIVGTDPPESGTVTNVLHRTKLLDIGGFRPHVGSGSDWDQVERWMDAGAKWAHLPRVTFTHKGDKRPWLED
jgi:GT2 family glycosyltransferase